MSREENDGSKQPTSSDPGYLPHLMRKIEMEAEEIVRLVNPPRGEFTVILYLMCLIEGLLRKVVKQKLQKQNTEGTRNDVAEERSLLLKFLDEVSGPVQTSTEFRAVKGGPLEVALLDATGKIVNSGPESSAEVEILLIDATGNGKECGTTNEDFERTIIRTGDKKKPHFAKNVYVNLHNGVGSLTNQKLGQGSNWTKNWTCRLGARFVKNFRGLKVQEVWTEPFKVKDNRSELYKKHEPPSPDSEVWRVKGIGRDGEPCKRLESKQIKTVLDLLFWLSVNPKGLQKITGVVDRKWQTIVAHARTCKIDDKMMYYHKSSTKPHMRVIYDYVGELKGVINESHFVPIDNLSADEKVHARELLSLVLEPSAFVERYKTFFNSEASLVQQYPYKSSNVNSSTNCSIQQRSNGIGSDYINCFQTAEPRCSSKGISPTNIYDSLESRDVGEISNHALVPIPDPENMPMDLGTASLDMVLEPSAFVERYKTFFNNEASLVQQYPYKSSNVNSSTNCSIQQRSNGIGSDYINCFQTAEPHCSSKSISPNNIYDSLESRDVGEISNHALVPIPDPENIPMDLDYGMYGIQPSTPLELGLQLRNCADEMTVSGERSLQLKFSDEWSLPVLTGKVLKGKTGNPMMVSLIDSTTGEVVDCEPESSAMVEMLLLDASDDDKESNWSVEDFNNRIINEDDKEKPHLAKSRAKYIRLRKGVGNICKLKLGQNSRCMKSFKCRLGARFVENFRGNEVKEALTESFVVSDICSKRYEKHRPPLLSDEVWRLKKIGRDGQSCRHLKAKKIETVQDFLFWLSVSPKELQEEILGAGDGNWQTIVTHAKTCIVDDKSMYSLKSSTEPQTAVVYDASGKLKGLIDESHFVPINDLSADKMDHAHKLLRSVLEPATFVQRYKTLFDDEASLLQQFPYRSLDTNASSFQSIIASDIYDSGPSYSLASKETGELRNHSLLVFPNPENIDGDTPTDLGTASLNNENLCFPTDKADGEASLNDVYYPQQQQLNGTYEMVGESSSRCSNTSFHSVNSTLGDSWWCGGVNWRDVRPPSPNPMLYYADNTQMYGHRDDETRDDEGVAEPQVTANPPYSWKI